MARDATRYDLMLVDDAADTKERPNPHQPRFPCMACGAETKEHHTPPESRICSNKNCRTVQLSQPLLWTRQENIERIIQALAPNGEPIYRNLNRKKPSAEDVAHLAAVIVQKLEGP